MKRSQKQQIDQLLVEIQSVIDSAGQHHSQAQLAKWLTKVYTVSVKVAAVQERFMLFPSKDNQEREAQLTTLAAIPEMLEILNTFAVKAVSELKGGEA